MTSALALAPTPLRTAVITVDPVSDPVTVPEGVTDAARGLLERQKTSAEASGLPLGSLARVWVLTEIWMGAEVAKLLAGGVLAGYIFTYKSRRRARRTEEPITAAKMD